MRLLITRPEEDGERLADALRSRGHEPVMLPLMEIVAKPLGPLPLSGVQALIATSRNALRALAENTAFAAAKRLPVYCVGEATSALAAELGFKDVHTGAGTAKDLVPLIARTAKPQGGTLLYLTGEQIAFDLLPVLSALRFTVRRIVIYAARENSQKPEALAELLRAGLDGVVLMSPRTSQIFARLFQSAGGADIRDLTCYCYSQAVARPLEHIDRLRIYVARQPQEGDLLALIGDGRAA
jgi:uroporphyrinogen-III synthase